MMADDLFIAFGNNFDNFFPTSECKLLPVANPFETYIEMLVVCICSFVYLM